MDVQKPVGFNLPTTAWKSAHALFLKIYVLYNSSDRSAALVQAPPTPTPTHDEQPFKPARTEFTCPVSDSSVWGRGCCHMSAPSGGVTELLSQRIPGETSRRSRHKERRGLAQEERGRRGAAAGDGDAPPPPSALLRLDEAVLLLAHRLHLCVGRVTRSPSELHGRPPARAPLRAGGDTWLFSGLRSKVTELSR